MSIYEFGRGLVLHFVLRSLLDVISFLGAFVHIEVVTVVVAVWEATLALRSFRRLRLCSAD